MWEGTVVSIHVAAEASAGSAPNADRSDHDNQEHLPRVALC